MSETMAASAGVSQTPVLHLDSIRKSFGSTTVLNGISFDVNQHEVVALLGPSGSGKSTLMKCVNLLERVDDGQIWLGDTDITNPRANQDKIRSRIGVVFQQFNLFPHMSVIKNVTLAALKVHHWIRIVPRHARWSCLTASACVPRPAPTPINFPAASSSAWPSREH